MKDKQFAEYLAEILETTQLLLPEGATVSVSLHDVGLAALISISIGGFIVTSYTVTAATI